MLDTIINGDCFEVMKGMDDHSIDAVITDPPYGLGITDWDTKIDIETFTSEVDRVLKPTGFYSFFCQMPTMLTWATETQKRFVYKEHISWVKRTTTPSYRLSRGHESILLWSKGRSKFYQNKGLYSDVKVPGLMFDTISLVTIKRHIAALHKEIRTGSQEARLRNRTCHKIYERFTSGTRLAPENVNYTNVWSFVPHNQKTFGKGGKEHPACKPLDIMLRLVEMLTDTGHVILDPYAGSGTTAIAAKMLNRHYIGIEQDKTYCEIAERRVAALDDDLVYRNSEKTFDMRGEFVVE